MTNIVGERLGYHYGYGNGKVFCIRCKLWYDLAIGSRCPECHQQLRSKPHHGTRKIYNKKHPPKVVE